MGIKNINPHGEPMSGPFIIACDYCQWTTLDIGIQFDRPTKLNDKLAAARKDSNSKQAQGNTESEQDPRTAKSDPDETFTALKNFMSLQISSAGSTNPLLTPGGGYNYDSPSSLARIMSLYTGHGSYGKKNTSKSAPMRESADASEGLHVIDLESDAANIQILREEGYQGITSLEQRSAQRFPTRSVEDLYPVPTLLRTKRAKRCRVCRHILVKPEAKVVSTRYRIRLIALNYVPTISLKPLQPPSSSAQPTPPIDLNNIPALKATQFLLTLKNSLFDPVKITLGTPTHTPGPFSHKATILCPQFDIGANVDAWDEALAAGEASRLSGKSISTAKTSRGDTEGMRVAEAGKVWDKGRNWTTVVVEVVCAAVDGGEGREDEDLLEIPVFVRMEYEADVEKEDGDPVAEKERKEKRELAYWVVVGAGRVAKINA